MVALYGFAYAEPALKFLESAAQAKYRGQIRRKIETLSENPIPQGCKKLQGSGNGADAVYRVRSGDYRILYSIRESPQIVVVLDIDHRKDVYR